MIAGHFPRRSPSVLIAFAAIQLAMAQNGASEQGEQPPTPQNAGNVAQPEEKKGAWVLAPIPINSPALGAGLQWAVARVFPLNKRDEISPPSVVGIGGVFTNNGTRAFALGGRLYLKEDRYRLAIAAGTASVNLNIYGIGQLALARGLYVPLNTDGTAFLGEFLYGLKKGVYIGVRGQYRDLRLSIKHDDANAATPPQSPVIDEISRDLFQQQTVSVGPRFQLDTRDNVYYPKRGAFVDFNADIFSRRLGSKFDYQYYKIGINKYNRLGDHQVIAFRAMGCAAAGDHVPLYDLCPFGAMNDIRGYQAGHYQDRRMFATQAEYRLKFPIKGFFGRFGVVAFGGFGGVAEKFSDIGWDELLPAGGAGLRFRVIQKYPINFRCDYGIGKGGHTLSIGILEAF